MGHFQDHLNNRISVSANDIVYISWILKRSYWHFDRILSGILILIDFFQLENVASTSTQLDFD